MLCRKCGWRNEEKRAFKTTCDLRLLDEIKLVIQNNVVSAFPICFVSASICKTNRCLLCTQNTALRANYFEML